MKTENIKISTALYAIIILFSIFTAFSAIISYSSLYKIHQASTTMFFDRITPLEQLKKVSDRLALDIVNTTYEMNHNTMDWQVGNTIIKKSLSEIDENWNNFLKTKIEGDELILKDEAEKLRAKAIQAVEDLLKITSVKNEATASQLNTFIETQLYTHIDPFIAQITKLMNIQLTIADKVYRESENTYRSAVLSLGLTIFSGLIIILAISLFVISRTRKSMKYANDVISEIASGNLDITIRKEGKDEISTLLQNMDRMLTRIKGVVSDISAGAIMVKRASNELNAASNQIAQGASEQASSIEEISASIEEMTSNIQQNLSNAQRSEQVSTKAANEVSAVQQSSMESLKSIKMIAEKISVIGSISFQTHILALNAAIEAARAGQQGKGFGVVAAEVGKLAERSKISAIEIDRLASNSVKITETAGALLQRIVPDIVSTSRFVQEITAANNEQSIGANQINNGVQQLNQVTQQNASASEELSSNASELSDMADDLLRSIEYFKIEKSNSKQISLHRSVREL